MLLRSELEQETSKVFPKRLFPLKIHAPPIDLQFIFSYYPPSNEYASSVTNQNVHHDLVPPALSEVGHPMQESDLQKLKEQLLKHGHFVVSEYEYFDEPPEEVCWNENI